MERNSLQLEQRARGRKEMVREEVAMAGRGESCKGLVDSFKGLGIYLEGNEELTKNILKAR